MSFRYRSCLMAALAVFCVLLCTSASIRAEDDGNEGHVVIRPTAADMVSMQAADAQTVQTVPLSTQGIAPAEFNGDVRDLPPVLVPRYLHAWNEFPEPIFVKTPPPGSASQPSVAQAPPVFAAPMPLPSKSFAGLSFGTAVNGGQAGAGWPPDTNGDVGPVYYIQAVNDAFGIFNKTTGAKVAAFTENQLWTPANTGTPCDDNNQGDPVAIHDGLADRWVLTNFAFDSSQTTQKHVPPFYQCFAVSKTSDPVAGGWYLYAVRMDVGGAGPPNNTLVDYPKFGFGTDCLYMGANGFNNATGHYAGGVFAAFDRTAMYSGSALNSTNSSVGFLANTVFGLFPANLQGTSADSLPPAGTPEYFVGESSSAFAFNVRKFQKGATACGAGSTLGAAVAVTHTAHNVPIDSSDDSNIVVQPGVTTLLDSLGDEVMQRVVYRKIGSAESLWVVHSTCGPGTDVCPSSSTPTQPQWVQINVSGGTVRTTPVQQQIYNPGDGLFRWMSSVTVDAKGDMAMGYSTSGASVPNYPSIAYAGRLVGDTLNQLPQTEVQLVAGQGSQNTCNTLCNPPNSPISRWGDYSAMVIDPSDDCTFWYTNLYYNAATHTTGAKWDTQIGSFKFPGCVTYTVTAASAGNGTITQPSQLVAAGAAAVFTVTPNTGYHVLTVKGNTCTVSNTSGTTWTSSAINQNCAVTATFAINTYSVTAAVSGGNGNITPPSQSINYNSTASVTVTPATGYRVLSVVGDTCTPAQVGTSTTWTTGGITAACVITAKFEINTYTVTAVVSGGNGNITPSSQTINNGSTASVIVTPATGYHVLGVVGDTCTPAQVGTSTTWTTGGITAACAITATFAINTYTVTASVNGANGTITPPSQPVNFNSTASFIVTPASGFLVLSVTGDTCSVSNTSGTTWTSSPITSDCAVSATFATTKLVFTQQPGDLLRGSLLGTIQVTEEDASNNVVDDSATVDFTIAACNGTVDLGSMPMVHGVATLTSTQAFYTVASGLQISASAATSSGTSQSFAVNANPDIRFADGFEGCRL